MVQRLPAGPSRRHPRSNACCGVMNAMRGSEFCATSQLSLTAIKLDEAQNGHEIFTEYLSARDPYPR
jgi:hypothetical protein